MSNLRRRQNNNDHLLKWVTTLTTIQVVLTIILTIAQIIQILLALSGT